MEWTLLFVLLSRLESVTLVVRMMIRVTKCIVTGKITPNVPLSPRSGRNVGVIVGQLL